MKRKYIKFELPENEFNDFERYLQATGQTKTEVLRKLLIGLQTETWKPNIKFTQDELEMWGDVNPEENLLAS